MRWTKSASGEKMSSMTPSGWHPAMYDSFIDWLRRFGPASRGGSVFEAKGVVASISPVVADRSVFNSVAYERSDDLLAALDDLERTYADARVNAWTVWVPESDNRTADALAARGHRLDARPTAMVLDLCELRPQTMENLNWTDEVDIETFGLINERAYEYGPGQFAPGIGVPEGGAFQTYGARLDGEVVSVLCTTDTGTDCGVWFVATLKHARGHGLAGRLLHVALEAARNRGMETSTLQATANGLPVYERLGYKGIGAIQMWEKRG